MYPTLKPEKKTGSGCLSISFLVLLIPMLFLYAWTIQVLWEWYVVPTFHVSGLNLAQAWGLSVLLNLVIGKAAESDWIARDEMDNDNKMLLAYANALGMPLFALFAGWVVHFWV